MHSSSILKSRFTPWIIVVLLAAILVGTMVLPAMAQKKRVDFKDMFNAHVGKSTNLGKLHEIGSDYVLFKEEGVTTVYSLSSIQGIRLEDDEASGGTTIEFLLH